MGSIAFMILAISATAHPADNRPEINAFLYQPSYEEDAVLRLPARPYKPQPGDIMLAADGSTFWLIMHKLAWTSHPTHSGIIFQRSDGTMAVLEGGPHDTLKCRALDALPHLASYEAEGRVWIRRRATPLTEEQSARLTEFACSADGKRFAIVRLGQQLTVLRPRGPVKTFFFGKPHGIERSSYYCSELVMEALVYAGAVDAETARPAATYPRDLFMDRSMNIYLNKHLKLAPCWDPPRAGPLVRSSVEGTEKITSPSQFAVTPLAGVVKSERQASSKVDKLVIFMSKV